jgi:hypothetical protein
MENLQFRDVRLHIRNGDLQDEYGGNFDLRPTTELAKNIFLHDVPGIFIKHAKDVSLRDVKVSWEGEMHPNFRHGLWTEDVEGLDMRDWDIAAPRAGQSPLNLVRTTHRIEGYPEGGR